LGTEEPAQAEQAATPPRLQDAAVRVGAHAIGAIGTRLELASVEIAAARERTIASLLLVGAAFACAILALGVATFGVIAYFWDISRFAAIALVALAYLVATALLWLRFSTMRRNAPPIFASTVEALRRDAARLGGGAE
jgi:uncharacterized membrane protein YqjE